ncbi:hypothetical protein [Oscillibacter sp.]|uniref:hypothetical protein n=1 Tax=Oscillibacter sp. TaxID=1945593 RepID=UPI0028982036|nr:hypothetical protein [Oscillibacter sp.]
MTQPLERRSAGILSDAELVALSELTAFAEGEGVCWGIENGKPVGGFWDLAAEVAKATAAAGAALPSGQARAVLAMRAFYLLGVLRGGEAYRNTVIDTETEPEFKDLPFELDAMAAADFAEDLGNLTPEVFRQLCALLGLSGPWAEDGAKGGAEV